MIPQDIPRSRLTRPGRLANRWAAALAEPDTYHRLRALLGLSARFAKHPKALATLWPSFLDSLLRGPHAAQLTQDDLAALAATGTTVAEGSAGQVSLAEAWFPLLVARDARGEHGVVTEMLTRLYRSPDLQPPGRATVARKLASRGAAGDEHLAVYVDYLAGLPERPDEPAITALLTRCLAAGFDVPPAQLRRAGQLAKQLHANGTDLPGVTRALGYVCLLLDHDPAGAARHLTAAHEADPADRHAFLGLLAALLRGGEHERLAATAGEVAGAPPVVAGLVELSATLWWLDDPARPGLAPSTANRLAALPVAAPAGDWLGYATGRLHLLEGATEQAARLLVAVADRRPPRPDWNYHAAWALHLLGDTAGVARRYDHTGDWTIGLVLADTDPARAQGLTAGLAEDHARVVTARRAMLTRTGTEPVELPTDSLAAALEALRTNLGVHFATRDRAAMTAALAEPVFHRLPLPDQLLWSGLARLPDATGRALLAQAADGFGYARAALVLTVHELRQDRAPAPGWARLFAGREDTTTQLVRAWHRLVAGDVDGAISGLSALAEENEPRAHYVLGTAWLLRDAFARAAAAFAAALEHDADGVVPAQAGLLKLCAELAADPGGDLADDLADELAGHWGKLDGATPWVTWTVALTTLRLLPVQIPATAYERLVVLLEQAEAPAAAPVVAAALVRACLAGDTGRHALFDRAARTMPEDEVSRLRARLTAGVLRAGGDMPDGHPPTPATALVLAERSLAAEHLDEAVAHLRAVPGGADQESLLCRVTADFLAGEPIPPDPAPEGDSPSARAVRLLTALGDPDTGLGHALTTLRTQDLSGVVDLRGVLPALCVRASRARQAPSHLEALVRATAADPAGLAPAVLAHCASAVGARDTALVLWRQAFTEAPADNAAGYAAALRHEAVAARRSGADRRAVDCLLLAAHVTTVGDPARLPRDPEDGLHTSWVVDKTRTVTRIGGPDAERARHAVLELCVARLLTHLFPAAEPVAPRPGRLSVLERAADKSLTLRKALLDDNANAVRQAWRTVTRDHAADIEFHHTLAVLYREHALADGAPAADLAVATALWSLLLSTESFWHHAGERVAGDEARFLATVPKELLTAHATRGRRALAAGDDEAAATHLRCLTGHGTTDALCAMLDRAGLPFRHDVDDDRFARVSSVAAEVLSEWVEGVLKAATAALTDPDEIARLPGGIKENYAGALEQLAPFLRLGVPVLAVLRTGLEWYNEWCFAEYYRDDHDRIAALTKAAAKLAGALSPLCDRGNGIRPENQALSRHLMFLGFSTEDHRAAARNFRAALEWNPANANAQQLLDQRADLGVDDQLGKAAGEVEKGQFAAALTTLGAVRTRTPDQQSFKDGLVTAAKFRKAFDEKDWTTAAGVLRTALAAAPPAERPNLATQLATLLNAQAVDLINTAQDRAKPLATAITEIFAEAQRRLRDPYGSPLGGLLRQHGLLSQFAERARDCAACGTLSVGRGAVVDSLVLEARASGEVRASDLVSFWDGRRTFLCRTCESRLDAVASARTTAVTLLTEARKLAPHDQTIRRNLDDLGGTQ